ncbi:MAG: HAD-IA family hydrolase [Mangrovicoccus sp.]|nr:HAD-IA family hydrolase [Mangrovicoccus sp.]
MSALPKLVIFDVDGTLVDSQGHIYEAMCAAFAGQGLALPERDAVRAIVGLSLPEAIARLAPELSAEAVARLVEGYKSSYTTMRAADAAASSPLFPGISAALETLLARDDLLVALATGKSRRGLDFLLEAHGLTGRFVSEQVADFHPSKPHPAMIHAALSDTGVEAANAVMIGDTSFDMEMGHAAGCLTLAVDWGYHPRAALEACAPHAYVTEVPAMIPALLELLELSA